MFIEKLSRNEILEFYEKIYLKRLVNVERFAPDKIENYAYKNGKITFQVFFRHFTITDFDFKDSEMGQLKSGIHDPCWLKFMYKKFGNRYAVTFFKYIKEEKLLAKIPDSEFYNLSKQYEKLFTSSDFSKSL